MITNAKIKFLQKLNQSKYRKQEQLFIVEGNHLVEEAKTANVLIEAYSINEKEGYITIDENTMKKICNTDTVVSEIGVCKYISKTDLVDHILILDAIQDPGNMGTLMRSACAFGFKTIFIGTGCVDIYNDKVIRSSQGAIFKINFLFGNIVDFIKNNSDYKFYGTNVVNGKTIDSIERTKKLAVILGNEGNGISKPINDLKLDNIFIPMEETESLNVAIAGSIIMYELR